MDAELADADPGNPDAELAGAEPDGSPDAEPAGIDPDGSPDAELAGTEPDGRPDTEGEGPLADASPLEADGMPDDGALDAGGTPPETED